MIRAMVSGVLYGAPQARTAASGKGFATGKVRGDGKNGENVWCNVIAFGEIADRLLTLADGASISISGRAEVNAWLDKQGEPRAGLSLVADELATLKGKPRPPQGTGDAPNARQGADTAPRQRRATKAPVAAGADFNDELPDFM